MHVGTLTLNIEVWTLNFRISKMIRWIVDKRHVGTHGSCVRPGRMPSKCTCLVKRTHEPCVPTCRVAINLYARLRGNCQLDCGRTHRPCVPTLAQTVLRVGYVDNQRLVPCVSIPAILRANLSHISVQYGSYYAVKWVRLKCRDARFVRPSRGNAQQMHMFG